MTLTALLAPLLLLAAAPPTPAPTAPPDLVASFRARDQALLDAIAPGDKKVWDAALAPEAVYLDENGRIIERAAFMDELKPLGPGASGHLDIVDYRLRIVGDTALVIQKAAEYEAFHGQNLRTDYMMSETWRHGSDGGWKLLMVHAWAVMKDPPAIALTTDQAEQYVGRYRAGDLVYVIAREGDGLVGGREGRALKPLKAEMVDALFVPGQPRTRKLFQRDHDGRITGFYDRREGDDLKWTRIQ